MRLYILPDKFCFFMAQARIQSDIVSHGRHTCVSNLLQRTLVKEQVPLIRAGPWTNLIIVRDQDSRRASFQQESRSFMRSFFVVGRATKHDNRIGVIERSFRY